MLSTAADLASWYWYVIKATARDYWDQLPGPWPVKITLIAVCLAIPGELDELALFAVLAWMRRRKANQDKQQGRRT
jgi:hypothetical protein